MKKNTLAVVALALLLVALTASCNRAKPAVVSEVQVTPTVTATTPAGGTLIAAASPSPTSEGIPTITRTPSLEAATPTPSTAAETTPTVALTPTPISTPAPTPAPTAAPGEQIHIVQPGENLFRIALRYGIMVEAMAAANGILNVNLVYPGQELLIP